MLYFSTNSEHYQVYACNAEMHEDWTKTLRVVDIIYHCWPDCDVMIMYELEPYKNYLGGWSLSFDLCHMLGLGLGFGKN